MAQYDIERLKSIPIDEVLEALGAEPGRHNGRVWHCFNKAAHNNGDAHPSLHVRKDTNRCKCYACGEVSGSPIDIATFAMGGDFKRGCEWLHESWNIPYLGESQAGDVRRAARPRKATPQKRPKRTVYTRLDTAQQRQRVVVGEWLPHLANLDKEQRMRLAYTYVYRSSLLTDQSPKKAYYAGRGIHTPWMEVCGWIGWDDARRILNEMSRWWAPDELEEFGIGRLWGGDGKPWTMYGDSIVVPSFSPYTDTVDGLMLRLVGPNRKRKEHAIQRPKLHAPLPFGLTIEMLRKVQEIWFVEGHVDGFALNQALGKAFVAFPGTHGWSEEIFGCFTGKDIVCAFDMDKPGIEAAEKIRPHLVNVGAKSWRRMTWDPSLGKDLNDLLLAGKLEEVYRDFLAGKSWESKAA